MNPVIRAENLSKTYKIMHKFPGVKGAIKSLIRPEYSNKLAVDNLNFTVDPAESVALIGLNGAGKSTTIKILTGVLLPSSGRVSVLGRDPFHERVANAREIAAIFGQRSQLWWDLPLVESLNIIAVIYNIRAEHYKKLLSRVNDILELSEFLYLPVRSMSLGQRIRAELASAFIREPRVMFLDEPTIGLDIFVKERIREFIRLQNQSLETTIVLTTHDLSDIESICNRIIIINDGRIIYDGELQAFRHTYAIYRHITFEATHPVETLVLLPGVACVDRNDRQITLRFRANTITAQDIVRNIITQIDVIDFSLKEPDLSSAIKEIYEPSSTTIND